MKKKIFAVFAALSLCLGLLSACDEAPEEIKNKISSGEITIDSANTSEVKEEKEENNKSQEETSDSKNESDKLPEENETQNNAQEQDKPDESDNAENRADSGIVLADKGNYQTSSDAPAQPSENNPSVGYNDRKSWWFKRNSENIPPTAQQDINISQYDAYYIGDTSEKIIYLTFDEGYENGYTSEILDILKENDVKAAFFVTKSYIKSCPDLVKRMVEEGHIVGNHSVTHPDLTELTDEEVLFEINDCADYFYEVTGTEMPKFFRPPQGVYSIRTLELTQSAGYKTIFWSYAYKDWDTSDQPGAQAAYDMFVENHHNGGIYLLHAVSQSNTEALDAIIKTMKDFGFTFKTLYDLP